jgi:hypothetical protein
LLVRGGGLALASFLVPRVARAAEGVPGVDAESAERRPQPVPVLPHRPARSCILVYLLGGPPHLDMFDLKPEAPAEVRGPFAPIDTAVPGLRICQHLPRLAQMAQRYALVRSVSHNNHNHTPMIYYTLTGRQTEQPLVDNDVRPPQGSDFPHTGAVLARLCPVPADLPGYIAIPELATRSSVEGEFVRTRMPLRGGDAGWLGPLYDPLFVNGEPGAADGVPALALPEDVAAARMERRAALLGVLEQRGSSLAVSPAHAELRRQAVALSGTSSRGAQTFSLAEEPPPLADRYGRHRFGRALLLSRRLAEAGVPMIAVHFNEMTVCDGWDTHSRNFEALEGELLPMVDQSLSALLEDLEQRGLAEDVLVVMMGEFGRTPKINASAGRDHWGSCQSVLLAGGGVRGGQVLGASDSIGAYPMADPYDPVDVQATIYHALGLDPESTLRDHLGRPHALSTGRPIAALL